jgi:hypothetical protein
MVKFAFSTAFFVATLSVTAAMADGFSTSALRPSRVPADGVIAGSYPAGGAETSYYFAADLKAGDLASQIEMMGRAGPDKSLEITLLDPAGKRAGGYYVLTSLDANQELARVLPIDASGSYVIKVTTKGPETTTFRVELGGSAFGNPRKTAGQPFSTSFLAPSPVPADGVIAGKFPMSADGVVAYYYFGTNLKAGRLLSQLSFAGRKNTPKMVEFTVLDARGRSVGSYYVLGELDANQEATKAIPIDASGPYVLRLDLKGAENTAFRLELGGDAIALR